MSQVLACASAVVGYYFARKRTEYEVGYRHRVEVAEVVRGMVIPLVEEFEAALEYVRAPGPSGELPIEELERSVDGLEKYVEQQELWLDRHSSAALGELIAGFRARQRELQLLPRRYDDPGFERAYGRAGADLEGWTKRYGGCSASDAGVTECRRGQRELLYWPADRRGRGSSPSCSPNLAGHLYAG